MEEVASPKIQRTISFVILVVLCALSRVMAQVQDGRPIADAGRSRYVGPDPVVLDGTRSYDPDNSSMLSYTWRQIGGPSVVTIDGNTATPTIAGSIQPGTGRNPEPRLGGFTQTDEIQECEFELVVSDSELTSTPDTVKVIIVPYFGINKLMYLNPPFDPDKPTMIGFTGVGGCQNCGPWPYWSNVTWDEKNVIWNEKVNFITSELFHASTYADLSNMIIVYLSSQVPDYKQQIQIFGVSAGGEPAIDIAIYLNETYSDSRYAVNRVALFDSAQFCQEYQESIDRYLVSAVDGEQCWVENYIGTLPGSNPSYIYRNFQFNVLNVGFDKGADDSLTFQQKHDLPNRWYWHSIIGSDMNKFNHGVIAGSFWSVFGPGKNLQLASTPGVETYKFTWYGGESSGYMDFYDETNHPGRLPEPVTLIGPLDVGDSNGFVLTCEESENVVGYQLLFGPDPYHIMDYEIISDTPIPPNDAITTIPDEKIWWTVRVRDQHGSTIYADPICLVANNPNPADGAVLIDTWMNLSWNEGTRAASYDVYFGGNYADVQKGIPEVFRGNQTLTYLTVGLVGSPYPDSLVPGTTYFWRVDDVGADGTVIHKGKIWRFTVSP